MKHDKADSNPTALGVILQACALSRGVTFCAVFFGFGTIMSLWTAFAYLGSDDEKVWRDGISIGGRVEEIAVIPPGPRQKYATGLVVYSFSDQKGERISYQIKTRDIDACRLLSVGQKILLKYLDGSVAMPGVRPIPPLSPIEKYWVVSPPFCVFAICLIILGLKAFRIRKKAIYDSPRQDTS